MSDAPNEWFVSESPMADQALCEMFRYLGYHAGPGGAGLRLAGKAIPLVTGGMVHDALAKVVEGQVQEPGAALDQIVSELRVGYLEEVRESGFQTIDSNQERILAEQQCLAEGQIRGWVKVAARDFFARFEVVAIEREMPIELPWGIAGAKLIRGTKADVVVDDKHTKNRFVYNWKTPASLMYMKDLPNHPQTMIECIGAQAHLGKKVHGFVIYGLLKGTRKKSKLETDGEGEWTGPEEQGSPFCYGWLRQEVLPFQEFDFQSDWRFIGSDGKPHTRGKLYRRAPVWENLPEGGMQAWVDSIPTKTLGEQFVELGPYFLDEYRVQQTLRMISGNEERWVPRLKEAYRLEGELGWKSPEFQAALDGLFARNYGHCENMFYRDCPMRRLCEKQTGWQELYGYRSREPHYGVERRIMEGQE